MGLDLSRLALRQAYPQEVEAQRIIFTVGCAAP
jgi:hypothetical protein